MKTTTIKDLKLSMLLGLIPKSKADFKHLLICILVFAATLYFTKNSGIALGVTAFVAIIKELNDQFAFAPFLLRWFGTGKPTGASGRDIWIGIAIPITLTILDYLNVINLINILGL